MVSHLSMGERDFAFEAECENRAPVLEAIPERCVDTENRLAALW